MSNTPEGEPAQLRRGVRQRPVGTVRCVRCLRTPLIGERIYVYEGGAILCELCRMSEQRIPVGSRMMHGPAFGHTMRIADDPAA